MAFKITARTLLELGAELISSDSVAIYELVKNSVDADSDVVRVDVQCILPYSRYIQALEILDEASVPVADLRQNVERWLAADAPVAAKRRFLASLDAASNTSSFRQAIISAYEAGNYIQVADDGDGMSLRDLDEIFLTIGTRSRRKKKAEWTRDGTTPPRPLLGDKGVGRLSVMRLGDRLEVVTSTAGERRWNELNINWGLFNHDSDALLHEVDVEPNVGQVKADPKVSGTTIRISRLRSDWDRQKFGDLLKSDFSRMVDPFDRRRGNRLFRITYNGEQVTLPVIAKRLFDLAHAVVVCDFAYTDDGAAKLTGEMDYRLHTHKKKTINLNEVQLVSLAATKSSKVLRSLGAFRVEFLWFNRIHLTALEGLGTKNDVLDLVRQWSGGLMVFRDGFRINPYGGPDDDWLQLDKRAFGRRGYKLNRQQVIGRVNLSWRNRHLVEQTNRQGLVDNEHKEALVAVLQRILEDFKTFSQQVDDDLKKEDLTSLDVLKNRVASAKTDLQKRIRQIAVDAPSQAGALNEVERLVKQLAAQIDGVDEIIDDYKDERRKFVHLAGLGLMVELILHELGRASGNTLSTLEGVDAAILPGKLPAVFTTLETQLKTLQKRIQTLDPLSTARRQTKEPFVVQEIVQQIVDARSAQAQRHSVAVLISSDLKQPWRIRAVKGMLIQILENLLSNSFYWLKQQMVIDAKFKPRIEISIDAGGQTISVTDNGPGIPAEEAEEVFKPFVSAKPPGHGSGLGLYIGRELAEYHNWQLYLAPGSKPSQQLNTFVLDLTPGSKA
ncbi:sensor histidine kinase [Rhizobium leguminosarum]|uniref:sensor histidine kinase n=1 Tax=Rhizobium leguminosarum TaxID=384 RepID=UPI00098E9634|nr:sensor histidine kinase [Rhizobium leguminosarum]MBB5260812.1 signal transduction histidine kinase [Rhizobium leguminosarum]MDX6000333.1 sensor histidine kinase [Rhizobium leguminosarum]OOO54061.1 hypothetical protein BS629_05290 [Rhizobium leguminosarum bv. viciae USDA 2370]PUB65233.1 hypothetical protein DB728_07735 [Rhizobium leguminosarum bv. viciae USDA 2370]